VHECLCLRVGDVDRIDCLFRPPTSLMSRSAWSTVQSDEMLTNSVVMIPPAVFAGYCRSCGVRSESTRSPSASSRDRSSGGLRGTGLPAGRRHGFDQFADAGGIDVLDDRAAWRVSSGSSNTCTARSNGRAAITFAAASAGSSRNASAISGAGARRCFLELLRIVCTSRGAARRFRERSRSYVEQSFVRRRLFLSAVRAVPAKTKLCSESCAG